MRDLSSESAVRNPGPKSTGRDTPQVRATGPDVHIEVQGSAIRLPEDRRAEQQTRLRQHLKSP